MTHLKPHLTTRFVPLQNFRNDLVVFLVGLALAAVMFSAFADLADVLFERVHASDRGHCVDHFVDLSLFPEGLRIIINNLFCRIENS